MTQRRAFLKQLGIGTLAAAQPAFALDKPSFADQFRDRLTDNPWLLGFKSVDRDYYQASAHVTGQLPKGLQGALYRNGPAQHDIGAFRYQHWFDGDGMVQAFRIGDGRVDHQARLVQTQKLQAERAAGRALYPGFATVPPNAEPVSSPDQINPANISMLNHGGRLFALWEAGSPYEIDARTLKTRGLHSFSTDTDGAPFSAHPRVDQSGQLWNFGYASAAGMLVIWHIDASGQLIKAGTIACDPMSMPHDFIVTRRHIVILIPPLHYETEDDSASFLHRHNWHADRATRVLVINKDDFDDHQWLELPAQWVFHFGNGWEDESGVIRFDGAVAPDPNDMLHSFRDIMRGVGSDVGVSRHHMYRIDTKQRTASMTPLLDEHIISEFPAIDPRVSCEQHNQVVCLTTSLNKKHTHGLLDAVSVIDIKREATMTFTYPEHQIPEEHIFVPAPESKPESRGWVIGSALDYREGHTLLNVFDATAIDAGPLASARLPYALPLGLHGKFVASA